MPRKGNVLDRTVRGHDHVVGYALPVEAIRVEVMHQVVGVERRCVTERALPLAEEDVLTS